LTSEEFSDQFDVLFNNITSNQAPGCTEYEKSVFLTKAQNEIVKNYFTANSKGNNIGQGFDDSAKRQADFSVLMKTSNENVASLPSSSSKLDSRSHVYKFPSEVFIIINEALSDSTSNKSFQIIPLRYDEYTRLMSKPFKRPLKHQAWRLINSGAINGANYEKYVEIIAAPEYDNNNSLVYTLRYLRRPNPIIVGDIDDLKINGQGYDASHQCELDPILHEDILQRAVELAKIAWTATGQDNAQMVLQAGQRSE
jgi:hypothetical protein